MPKTKKVKQQYKVAIDPSTSKGNYADGFGISISTGVAVLDFTFFTPEGSLRIVNRTIMPMGMLKALSDDILEKLEKKENGKKKTSK